MARHLRLSVLTPERALLEVPNAVKVRLRLADGGWLSIYPGHAALIAETEAGSLYYETEVEAGEVLLDAGVLQITGTDQVVVLAMGLEGKPEGGGDEDEMRFAYGRLAAHLMDSLRAASHSGGVDDLDQ